MEANENEFKVEFTNFMPQDEQCKKWNGQIITLDQLPSFLEEVGRCVINIGTIEVYNDYRE